MEKVLFADTFTKTFKDIFKVPDVVVDNPVFRLHYKFTGLALLFASILVSGYQFFGDPIKCIQKDDIPEQLLETYCWIEGTFTLPKALTKQVGTEVVYHGVDKYIEGDEVIEHAYYQWVCFLLFLQSLMFCFPYFAWKTFESGKLLGLMQDLRSPVVQDKEDRLQKLAIYFQSREKEHNSYALKLLFCEVLNFVNVVLQIFFVDRFLGGQFTTFGTQVIRFVNDEQSDRLDPMIRIFPRITKCSFHKFGSSGDVQKHDALCLLPLNIVNEKIFVVMWFWFVILAVISGLLLVFRVVSYVSGRVQFLLLGCVSNLTTSGDLDALVKRICYGDWLVLYLLAGNIDNRHFRGFVRMLGGSPAGANTPDAGPSPSREGSLPPPPPSEASDGQGDLKTVPVRKRVQQYEEMGSPALAFSGGKKGVDGEEVPLMTFGEV